MSTSGHVELTAAVNKKSYPPISILLLTKDEVFRSMKLKIRFYL